MANSTSNFTAPPPSGMVQVYSPEKALIFIGVSLGLGALCRQVLQNTRIPYTVAVLLIGVGLGALEFSEGPHLGHLGESIRMWATINPNLILYVFLPALLFESSFNLEFHQIKRCIFQMLLLAGPGVVISTVLLGCVDKFLLPYGFNWSTSLLLGGLLSATDPVAVVALLKSLGASKKLSTIIDGEALMNDGVAIVVFQIFFNITVGRSTTGSAIISSLFQATVGACALGLLFGVVTLVWIRFIFNDYVQEITIVITAAYMCFYVANDETNMSGVLATLVLGVEMITYIANTLIFTLSGVVIAATILESGSLIKGADWGYLLLLYLFVQLARFAVVGILFPGLASSGYGLDWKEGMILGWSGLRGAVALTLALLIYHQPTTEHLSDLTKARIMFLTGGVTFLTLIINGSTTQFLLAFLGLSTVSSTKKRVLEFARHEMYDRALETFEEVGEDEELGPADWPTVRKYVHCLNRPRHLNTPHPHRYNSVENLREQQLHDTRIRYLSGVQAAYWTMLEEGRISQTATLLLMQAAAESVDRVNAYHPLELWKGLRPHVKLPTLLKIVQGVRWFPQRWKSSLTVYRVELGAVISAAFLRAQKHARQQLRDWLGESDVAETVLRESREEEVEPRKFLEDVRLSFPQVLRIIKTKQVTSAILSGLTVYVDTLGKAGLLDEKETCALQMAVQTDVKKLQRDPPLVDMPTAAELLATQPLIGALPVSVRSPLEGAAKQHTKLSGSVLAREGEVPDGVWLIASGAVKEGVQWTVEDSEHRAEPGESEELHPVLAHGSVVGLYAVLANIPHICTATTGSLVQSFFLPRLPIMEASRSSYEVLDFLWLEASLPLVKLVFSRQFRGLSIQDLRSFASTSRLLPMRRLATLELLPQECAILLEGSMAVVGREGGERRDGMKAPCGLLSCGTVTHPGEVHTCSSSCASTAVTFSCLRACRVLVLDLPLGTLESSRDDFSDASPQEGRSVRPTDSGQIRDHDGLLRWSSGEYEDTLTVEQVAKITGKDPAGGSRDDDTTLKVGGGDVEEGRHMPKLRQLSARALEIGAFGTNLGGRATHERGHKRGRGRERTRLARRSQVSPHGRQSMEHCGNPLEDALLPTRSRSHPVLPRQGKRPLQSRSAFDLPTNEKGGREEDARGKALSELRTDLGERVRPLVGEADNGSDDGEEHVILIDSPHQLFGTHRFNRR